MDEGFQARLEARVARLQADTGLTGVATAVMTNGQLAGAAASGERRRGSGIPVNVDDRWHVGSITKSMTATLLAVLEDDGRLSRHVAATFSAAGRTVILSPGGRVAERERTTDRNWRCHGSTARCCGRRRHRQANSVRVCSPTSRRVASLRPRSAGLTALTPARTLVQMALADDAHSYTPCDVPSRMTLFRATADSRHGGRGLGCAGVVLPSGLARVAGYRGVEGAAKDKTVDNLLRTLLRTSARTLVAGNGGSGDRRIWRTCPTWRC